MCSSDLNAALRNKLMNPIEVPLFGVLVAGFVALGISRVFLAVPKVSASWIFIGVAATIFVVAILLSLVPKLSRGLLLGVVVVGAVAVLVGGIAGVTNGPREFHDETEEFTVEGEGSRGGGVVYRTTSTVAGGTAKAETHGKEGK